MVSVRASGVDELGGLAQVGRGRQPRHIGVRRSLQHLAVCAGDSVKVAACRRDINETLASGVQLAVRQRLDDLSLCVRLQVAVHLPKERGAGCEVDSPADNDEDHGDDCREPERQPPAGLIEQR